MRNKYSRILLFALVFFVPGSLFAQCGGQPCSMGDGGSASCYICDSASNGDIVCQPLMIDSADPGAPWMYGSTGCQVVYPRPGTQGPVGCLMSGGSCAGYNNRFWSSNSIQQEKFLAFLWDTRAASLAQFLKKALGEDQFAIFDGHVYDSTRGMKDADAAHWIYTAYRLKMREFGIAIKEGEAWSAPVSPSPAVSLALKK
jgi:hypothetical protein